MKQYNINHDNEGESFAVANTEKGGDVPLSMEKSTTDFDGWDMLPKEETLTSEDERKKYNQEKGIMETAEGHGAFDTNGLMPIMPLLAKGESTITENKEKENRKKEQKPNDNKIINVVVCPHPSTIPDIMPQNFETDDVFAAGGVQSAGVDIKMLNSFLATMGFEYEIPKTLKTGDLKNYVDEAQKFLQTPTVLEYLGYDREDITNESKKELQIKDPALDLVRLQARRAALLSKTDGNEEGIEVICVEDIEDAYNQIQALKKHYKIKNIIFDGHGKWGRQHFEVGNTKFEGQTGSIVSGEKGIDFLNEQQYSLAPLNPELLNNQMEKERLKNKEKLTQVAGLMDEEEQGVIVINACYVGSDDGMFLAEIAETTQKTVLGGKSWFSSMPGMFNVPKDNAAIGENLDVILNILGSQLEQYLEKECEANIAAFIAKYGDAEQKKKYATAKYQLDFVYDVDEQAIQDAKDSIKKEIQNRIAAVVDMYNNNEVSVGGGTIIENPPFVLPLSKGEKAEVIEKIALKYDKSPKDIESNPEKMKEVEAECQRLSNLKAQYFLQYYASAGKWLMAQPDGLPADGNIAVNIEERPALIFNAVGGIQNAEYSPNEEEFGNTPFGALWYEMAESYWNTESPKEHQGTFDLNNDGKKK